MLAPAEPQPGSGLHEIYGQELQQLSMMHQEASDREKAMEAVVAAEAMERLAIVQEAWATAPLPVGVRTELSTSSAVDAFAAEVVQAALLELLQDAARQERRFCRLARCVKGVAVWQRACVLGRGRGTRSCARVCSGGKVVVRVVGFTHT